MATMLAERPARKTLRDVLDAKINAWADAYAAGDPDSYPDCPDTHRAAMHMLLALIEDLVQTIEGFDAESKAPF